MTSIELLQDELIIASAAFIMYQYSANQKENGDGSSTLYINKDRRVGHLCHILNELSAFGETFKQQIVNSSPKYCNSQRGTSQTSS